MASKEVQGMIRYTHIIPTNTQSFRALWLNSFKFADSMAFLPHSLDNLSTDFKNRELDYNILKQSILTKTNGKFDFEKFQLCKSKLAFPYEKCTSINYLHETKEFPEIREFKSSLTNSNITKAEHLNGLQFWNTMACKSLQRYAILYCHLGNIFYWYSCRL